MSVERSIFGLILSGCALWVLWMYAAAMLRGSYWRKRDAVSVSLQPRIREVLIDFLAGSDDRTKIREFVKLSSRDVGDVLFSFQATVGGGARDRLCELALEQALVHEWCEEVQSKDQVVRRTAFERLAFVSSYEPCRRVSGDPLAQALDDPDPDVSFSAAMAALQSGSREEIERVFHLALTHDLLIRILLSQELRRHASLLCERAIPEALASEDYEKVRATLDMLVAWERALPLANLARVMGHPNREIRLQALRLTPLVPSTTDTQGAILDALADPDAEVAIAACVCAGRLKIGPALPGLARCLRRGEADLARAAAAALAEMPGRGWATLHEMSTGSNQIAAEASIEALAAVQGKR